MSEEVPGTATWVRRLEREWKSKGGEGERTWIVHVRSVSVSAFEETGGVPVPDPAMIAGAPTWSA